MLTKLCVLNLSKSDLGFWIPQLYEKYQTCGLSLIFSQHGILVPLDAIASTNDIHPKQGIFEAWKQFDVVNVAVSIGLLKNARDTRLDEAFWL